MSDFVYLLIVLVCGFPLGFLIGYRLGVIHGYDKAEEMVGEIVKKQIRRRALQRVGIDPPSIRVDM